ncbi:MAG: hypothetical protein KIT62_03810 [Cyclobacteriaceae bacterium]|nr:hypothetical protein [Cyclobacteriaceae bacterium]
MKVFVSFCLVVILSADLAAQPSKQVAKMPLTKAEFLKLADGNDSLAAVINLFYRKRKESDTSFTIAGVSLGIGMISGFGSVLSSATVGESTPGKGAQIISYTSSTMFVVASVIGTGYRIKYSRKKLHHIILGYDNGNPIPGKFVRALEPTDFN